MSSEYVNPPGLDDEESRKAENLCTRCCRELGRLATKGHMLEKNSPRKAFSAILSAFQTLALLGTLSPTPIAVKIADAPLFDGAGNISQDQPEKARRQIARLSMTTQDAVTTVSSPFAFDESKKDHRA